MILRLAIGVGNLAKRYGEAFGNEALTCETPAHAPSLTALSGQESEALYASTHFHHILTQADLPC